jgi:hypothetical protein
VSVDEIQKWAEGARERGHEWVQLVVVRASKPRTNHVRIAPGLLGRVVGPLSDTRYLVDLAMVDVERWLATHGNGTERKDGE